MFCFRCGCQLHNDAVFCHQCGEKVSSLTQVNHAIKQESISTELNRDALKIYLHDVLTLECIKNKYITKLSNTKWWISNTPKNYFEKHYKFVGSESWYGGCSHLYFLYWGEKYYLWMKKDSLDGNHPYTEDLGNRLPYRDQTSYTKRFHPDSYFLDIEKNNKIITNLEIWSRYGVTGTSSFFEKNKKAKVALSSFLRSYEDFKKVAPVAVRENNNKITSWTKIQNGITKELNDVNKLLSKAYCVNIIPSQFRNNLYAAYYLYDFINSSNQSFTTALLHFDLQEIKSKLDKIIKQQQEIIIQQALIIAQNEKIITQNQACLQRLSSLERVASNIEYNTAQAATYSSIAANNAEVCAWIGLANYLKD